MKRNIPVLVLVALLGSVPVFSNAWADGHDGRGGFGWGHRDDRGGRDGHWERGWHGGPLGWLWVVGNAFLLYNVARTAAVPQPPAVIVPTPASVATPTSYWYYCSSSGTYYPYVQTCPEGWQTVAAAPPPPN